MQISGVWVFVFGCFGGSLLELLRWWKIRESPDLPAYWNKKFYWLLTFAMIAAGGLIATAYGSGPVNAIQAMNIGASAPALIGALFAEPRTSKDADRTSDGADTRKFEGGETDKLGGRAGSPSGRLRRFLAFG